MGGVNNFRGQAYRGWWGVIRHLPTGSGRRQPSLPVSPPREPADGTASMSPPRRSRRWGPGTSRTPNRTPRSSSPRPASSCRTSPASRASSTLATMREELSPSSAATRRGSTRLPRPSWSVDHSVQIDVFSLEPTPSSAMSSPNTPQGAHQFLRWGPDRLRRLLGRPAGTGIVHQVNIERLARVTMVRRRRRLPGHLRRHRQPHDDGQRPGVLGWGVGGIEAEAAMLGQPVSMLIPRVVGFSSLARSRPRVTATDVVLTITDLLRKHGVVGKFVEFYGEGVSALPLANRATIGNMSPEFGSTCAIFPIDGVTLDYPGSPGRTRRWRWSRRTPRSRGCSTRRPSLGSPRSSLDLGTVVPSIAGPKRPQDRIVLTQAGALRDRCHQLRRRRRAAVRAGCCRWRRARPRRFRAARRCGHRLDHLLHEHLEPVGHDGGRDARQERRGAWPGRRRG